MRPESRSAIYLPHGTWRKITLSTLNEPSYISSPIEQLCLQCHGANFDSSTSCNFHGVFPRRKNTILKFCSQHRDKWNVSVTCLKPCVERHDFSLTVLQSNRTEYDLDYSRHMLGQFKVCQLLICNF